MPLASKDEGVDKPTPRRLLCGVPGVEVEGFRIVVNTRDERGHKPHVHVIKSGSKCKVELDEMLTPYDIRMSKKDVRRARELVGEHFGVLAAMWEKFNG